jgi:putative transcriptional regulator
MGRKGQGQKRRGTDNLLLANGKRSYLPVDHIRQKRDKHADCERKRVSKKISGGMEPMKKKRSLFEELKQGIEEINQHFAGKITLKTYTLESKKMPEITPEIIRDTRERLNLSRPVFAHELHVSPRTMEKWEQGLTKPNDQAATLIMMVRKFPDTLQRLKQLSA